MLRPSQAKLITLAVFVRKRDYNRGNTIPLCDWYFPFLSL
jgi:hypothetical protein